MALPVDHALRKTNRQTPHRLTLDIQLSTDWRTGPRVRCLGNMCTLEIITRLILIISGLRHHFKQQLLLLAYLSNPYGFDRQVRAFRLLVEPAVTSQLIYGLVSDPRQQTFSYESHCFLIGYFANNNCILFF